MAKTISQWQEIEKVDALLNFYEDRIKNPFLEKTDEILENAFLIVLALYLFRLFIGGTTIGVMLPVSYEWVVRILAGGIGILRLQRNPVKRKYENLYILLFIIGCGLPYLKTGYTFLLDFPIFILGCNGIYYKKVLKVYLITGFAVLMAAMMAVFMGQAIDLVYLRSYEKMESTGKVFNKIYSAFHLPVVDGAKQLRHSMGVMYCTDFGAWCFSLMLALWIYFEKIPGILFSALFFVMSYVVYSVAGARNIAGLFLMAMFAAAFCNLMELMKKKESLEKLMTGLAVGISVLATPICILIVYVTLFLVKDDKILKLMDNLLTGRLEYSKEAISEYGITWLGSFFHMMGNGGTDQLTRMQYTFVDISYVLIFVRYGIIFSVMLLFMYIMVGVRGSKSGNYRIPMTMALFAAQGIIEHHMVEHAYVILLMLPLANFVLAKKEKKRKNAVMEKVVLYVGNTCIVAGGILIALYNVSAYRSLLSFSEPEDRVVFLYPFIAVVLLMVAACELHRKRAAVWKIAVAVAGMLIVLFLPVWMLSSKADENLQELSATGGIFEKIMQEKENSGYKVYCEEDSYFAEKEWKKLDKTLMTGNGMSGLKDAVIVTSRDRDLYVLNNVGFSYVGITDNYGIYTNSDEAKNILKQNGYAVCDVYNETKEVEFDSLQSASVIPRDEEGDILMGEENEVIFFGPLEVLNGTASRDVQLDIQLDMKDFQTLNHKSFVRVSIVTTFEKKRLYRKQFTAEDISADGVISLTFSKYYNEDYYVKVETFNGNSFEIRSVKYHKVK